MFISYIGKRKNKFIVYVQIKYNCYQNKYFAVNKKLVKEKTY